jgi:thiamine monophosphate synthase
VAIGGIDAGNAYEVAQAGAGAVAVITAVFGEAQGVGRTDESTIEGNARRVVEAFDSGARAAGATPPTSTMR